MERITIYYADEIKSVTLPRCRVKLVSLDESIVKTMASGLMVEDVRGTRDVIFAKYGYVPAADIVKLKEIEREGGFHRVLAPGVDGGIDARFKLSPVPLSVFRFVGGQPVWCNVELKLTAQRAVRNEHLQ